jgi:hypothetical protein
VANATPVATLERVDERTSFALAYQPPRVARDEALAGPVGFVWASGV